LTSKDKQARDADGLRNRAEKIAGRPPVEYFRKLYQRHFQGALVQAGASLIMWLFALAAYALDIIAHRNFVGVSLAVLYLIAINPPTLWIFKRIQDRNRLVSFSIFINLLEIMGYTAVIYFLGGIEATYLTILYAALIAFVGSVSNRRHTFLITCICIVAYNAMILMEGAGLIPWYKVSPDFFLPWSHRLARMFVVDGLLLVVAYITSYTAILLRKAKGDLLAAYGILEQRVAERTNELSRANEELRSYIIEIKKTEEALVQNEKRLLMITDNSTDIIWMLDMDFNFTFLSPSFEQMLGYPMTEYLGKPYQEIISPESYTRLITVLTEELRMEDLPDKNIYRSRIIETEQTHKNGTKLLVELSMTFVRNFDQKPIGILGFSRNITEKKIAKDALKASKERYKLLFDSINEVIYSIDLNYTITSVSPSMERYLGYKNEEFIGKSVIDLNILSERYLEKGFSQITRVLQGEVFESEEYEFITKDRKIKFAEVSGAPIIENGKIIGMISMARDITDRKQAEEALWESEERFRLTFNFSPDAVCINRMDNGLFIDINKGFTREIGFTREDVIGKAPSEINIWQNPSDRKKLVQGLQEKGYYENLEAQFLRKDGSIRTALMSASVIALKGAPHIISSTRDITESKLIAAKLQQAQKMESVGSLAGGIAHDLNNILFPISGLSEMLLNEMSRDNSEYGKIEQIHQSAKRGSDLVKQILTFSRQSNPMKLPIRIQPIMKEVLNLARATIPKNIEIASHILPDCGMVLADPTQVHQIAMNLITNAYHAVEEKGGTINLELKETLFEKDNSMKSGRYACLTISDNGTGIDQSLIDKIFDPYFTTKELGKGTGLGLSVVHGIVKEHGGDIRACSEVGKGTTFDVYLPLLGNASDSRTDSLTRKYPTGCESILLVDDEEPIVRMEQMILEKLGYQVSIRTSSLDVLADFKTDPSKFDLVISDRGMPDMTGEQLAWELISIRPDIPIIICTGFSDNNDEKRARELGVKGFLMKPVAMGDLAEMVRKILNESKVST